MLSLDNLAKLAGKCPSVICSLMQFPWLSHGSHLEGHALYLVGFWWIVSLCSCEGFWCLLSSQVAYPFSSHHNWFQASLSQQQCSHSRAEGKALGVKILTPEILKIQVNTKEFRFSFAKMPDFYFLLCNITKASHIPPTFRKKGHLIDITFGMSATMQEYWLLSTYSLVIFKDQKFLQTRNYIWCEVCNYGSINMKVNYNATCKILRKVSKELKLRLRGRTKSQLHDYWNSFIIHINAFEFRHFMWILINI